MNRRSYLKLSPLLGYEKIHGAISEKILDGGNYSHGPEEEFLQQRSAQIEDDRFSE